MGFFDSTGGRVGTGILTSGLSELYRTAEENVQPNMDVYFPNYVTGDYLQGLESTAQSQYRQPQSATFADYLLQANQEKQRAQAASMAASSRGDVSPALLQRNIMRQTAEAGQQAAQSAGLIKAKEAMEQRKLEEELAFRYRQMAFQAAQAQAQSNLEGQRIKAGLETSAAQARGQLMGAAIGAAAKVGSTVATGGAAAHGGMVEGKAKVKGDHPANDTVPVMLSPGEIVVPRSKADDPEKAKEFIEQIKGMKSKKSEKMGSYGKLLEKTMSLEAKIKELEKKVG